MSERIDSQHLSIAYTRVMELRHVRYFLALSERPADSGSMDAVKASQESNELQLLRLVKCLKQHGKI